MPDPRARAKNVPLRLDEIEDLARGSNVLELDPIEITGEVSTEPEAPESQRLGQAASERNAVRLSDVTGGRVLSGTARDVANGWLGALRGLGAEVTENPRLDALTAGAGESGSFGFIDELAGGARALLSRADSNESLARAARQGANLDPRTIGSALEAQNDLGADVGQAALRLVSGDVDETDYIAGRDRARAQMDATREADPTMFGAGEIVGTLPQMALPSGVARAQTGLGRAGLAAAESGALTALQGLGQSEADDVGGALADSALAGTAGAALGGTLQAAPEAIRALNPGRLRQRGNLRRLRGVFGGDRPSLETFRQIAGPEADQPARVANTLSTLEELGVRTADQAPEAAQRVGGRLGELARDLDIAQPERAVDADAIARMLEERGATLQRDRGIDPSRVGAFQSEAARWRQGAEAAPMTFSRALDFKREMSAPGYWAVGPGGSRNQNYADQRAMYGLVREQLEREANAIDPALGGELARTNEQYGVLAPFVRANNRAEMGAAVNNQISPTDMAGMGLGGQGGGGVLSQLSGLALNRARRGYEHRIAGRGMNALANVAESNAAPALEALGTGARRAVPGLISGPDSSAATAPSPTDPTDLDAYFEEDADDLDAYFAEEAEDL
jgi:hypothetical protein